MKTETKIKVNAFSKSDKGVFSFIGKKDVYINMTICLFHELGHVLSPSDKSFAIEFENIVREILYGPKYDRRPYDDRHLP